MISETGEAQASPVFLWKKDAAFKPFFNLLTGKSLGEYGAGYSRGNGLRIID